LAEMAKANAATAAKMNFLVDINIEGIRLS
jgi:hypothetical protein